jgi:indolepyruvate ferredoxin oxidoreductase beta subunit
MVGIGGQGIITASDILCNVAVRSGLDVKKSEIHGMSQRGGGVNTHVRFGEKVYSPLISKSSADFIIAFEQLETLRYLDYIKDGCTLITNTEKIYPPSVNLGVDAYPDNIIDSIKHLFSRVIVIDCIVFSEQIKDKKLINMAILGGVSTFLPFLDEIWIEVIKESFRGSLVERNVRAFRWGVNFVKGR